jgi:hypothetical protein
VRRYLDEHVDMLARQKARYDLRAQFLAYLFDDRPNPLPHSPALTEETQGWLLSNSAFCLRALGRLSEAIEPMRAGLGMAVKREDWTNAATAAGNLSQLELEMGEVALAAADAEQSVTYAEQSGGAGLRITSRLLKKSVCMVI